MFIHGRSNRDGQRGRDPCDPLLRSVHVEMTDERETEQRWISFHWGFRDEMILELQDEEYL